MGLLHMALDLGSSSGKITTGEITRDGTFRLCEVSHFATPRVWLDGHLCIDVYRVYEETLDALRKLGAQGVQIDTFGADSWSSDFGLIDASGELIGLPVFYRDQRTLGMPEQVEKMISYAALYRYTKQQRKRDATLCQLVALQKEKPLQLGSGNRMLFLGDILMYFFSGRVCTEFSLASYSQLYSTENRRWENPVFELFNLPVSLQTEVVEAGARLGRIDKALAQEMGQKQFEIITPAGHDTASAIAAIPAVDAGVWAFIATGSWYLVGMELDKPTNIDLCYQYNFSNTGMAFGKTMLKRNVTAMWILQECMHSWREKGLCYEYAELHAMAEQAEPFAAMLDVDAPDFYNPADMPAAICAYLKRTGQAAMEPGDVSRLTRLVDEGIAFKCAYAVERLETITGKRIEILHMVGGAVAATVLNQMIADATGKEISAGLREATCIGNCLLQAYGSGELTSEAQLHEIVARTYPARRYLPQNPEPWARRKQAFRELCGLKS